MINKRSFLGIPLARRRTRRWLVVGFWVLLIAVAALFPLLLRIYAKSFVLPAELTLLFAFFLTTLLGGDGQKGIVRDFHGRTPEEGPADYTFMTPEDIAAHKQADKENRLDEREVNRRNAVHYKAYSALNWIAVPLVLVAVADRSLGLVDFGQSMILLFLFIIQALPQSILLWTEPDMEEPQ